MCKSNTTFVQKFKFGTFRNYYKYESNLDGRVVFTKDTSYGTMDKIEPGTVIYFVNK